MEPTSTSKTSTKGESEAAPAKKTKAAKQTKAPKEPKPSKREKIESPVVFAFRLSEAERTRIHDAAGGGKASQFVLAAALAAADGDVEGFKKVIAARATK